MDNNKLLDEYNEKLSQNPNDCTTLYNRGKIYNNLKRFHDALADFSLALQFEPDNLEILHQRIESYMALNQLDLAFNDLNKVIEHDKKDDYLHYLRGKIYFQRKHYENALNDFSEAIAFHKNSNKPLELYYLERSKCYEALGDYLYAKSDLEKARDLSRNDD